MASTLLSFLRFNVDPSSRRNLKNLPICGNDYGSAMPYKLEPMENFVTAYGSVKKTICQSLCQAICHTRHNTTPVESLKPVKSVSVRVPHTPSPTPKPGTRVVPIDQPLEEQTI